MGGATLGYALARAGWRVLFCERGRGFDGAADDPGRALRGDYAENFLDGATGDDAVRAVLRRAGRYVDPVDDLSSGHARPFVPFIGSGVGGSSALYGMALERFRPEDFEPARHHHGTAGVELPSTWPVSHDEFAPWYDRAERLYGVQRPAGDVATAVGAEPNRELVRAFQGKGLHPYALPMAREPHVDCPACQGFLCARGCKHDGANSALRPAIEQHGATLLADCGVVRLEADADRVTAVHARVDGHPVRLAADHVFLATGALNTPALLLNSTSADWPAGLANRSGLVGRYLMRHCVDLYAIFAKARPTPTSRTKEFALDDFYATDDGKFGSLQSFGPMPPPNVVVDGMQQELREDHGAALAALFGLAKPFLRPFLGRTFAKATMMASILEDLPRPGNHVGIRERTDDGMPVPAITYRLDPADQIRIRRFRALIREALQPYRFMLLDQAANNRRIAHVCGTCRFGDDPETSVLDPDNRAHGIANLWVVDASFFPTSGGTNPALTIAANALRVAARLTGGRGRPDTSTDHGSVAQGDSR